MKYKKSINDINDRKNIKTLQQTGQDLEDLISRYLVVVPSEITVHLGNPDDDEAEDITVPYLDYIKNVGSSELYPTWPEEALRANIHAITSVAMNRIFTEWYRSRGYNFDITNSTQYDQAFVPNRGVFDSINVIADEIFTHYIVREGQIQPLYARFCDGRISQCDGLLQWGSVELANKGYSSLEILQYYYGENIEIVTDAPVGNFESSYHGEPLQLGDSSVDVLRMELYLDRIRTNYPGIPKIDPLNGYFNETTERAVKVFQDVFNLPVTGIVDEATWYTIRYIYNAVTRLAELTAQGLLISRIADITRETYLQGDIRPRVGLIQYALNVLAAYFPTINEVAITGIFDNQTREQVIAFQKTVNLEPTGVVDRETFEALVSSLFGILDTLPSEAVYLPSFQWPGVVYESGDEGPGIYVAQEMLSYISLIIPIIPYIEPNGVMDEVTQRAVISFQGTQGIVPTGIIDEETWNSISNIYRQQRYGAVATPTIPGEI